MIGNITKLQAGKTDAYLYETAIKDLLVALFYPVLVDPSVQTSIHAGLKRIDITFTNNAIKGFFQWLSMHYPCSHIIVECKNYEGDIQNPEIDQAAMRLSKDRGKFGIIVCRKISDREAVIKRCQAVAKDGHGYIVVLDDSDLRQLIQEVQDLIVPDYKFSIIKKYFDKLIF